MRIRSLNVVACLTLFSLATLARAAALPISVDLTALRTIQPYAMADDKTDDQAYFLVSGVAAGKEISERFPKEGALPAAPKKPAVTDKSAITAWKGELNDGEFALVAVTVMQGDGKDEAKVKDYLSKLTAACEAGWKGKAPASKEDFTKLAAANLKAERGVITKIKDTFSRAAKTDHYGGLFNVLIWNNGGKLMKRLDPVGLTFGEHYGTDVKVYTKLKSTRANVLVQDDKGGWSQVSMMPTSDDDSAVRVKMEDIEEVKGKETFKHVTDYLAEVQLKASGKPVKWDLEGEVTGYDVIHTYWDFAD